MLDFVYITDPNHCSSVLASITSSTVALDLETYCKDPTANERYRLNPHTGDISVLSVYDGHQVYVFDWLQLYPEVEPFNKFLSTRQQLIAHNAVFDGSFLRAKLNRRLHNWRCTYLLSLLIANATGSKFGRLRGHRLDDLCRDILGVKLEGKGTLQTSEWGISDRTLNNPHWVEKLRYAAADVKHLPALYEYLWQAATKPITESGLGMEQTAELEMQNITATIELVYRGLPINTTLAADLDDQVHKQRKQLAVKLCKEFNLPTLVTDLFSPEEPAPDSYKALNNPKSLLALISKKMGKEFPSTQSALLERLLAVMEELSTEGNFEYKDEEEEELYKELEQLENSTLVQSTELVRMVLDYRRLTKQIGFDLRQYLNPVTQRVHPSYNALGTATGRFSSSKPNAQQISARLSLNVPLDTSQYTKPT